MHHFAETGRLQSRVVHAVNRGEKITFLFGSALTAPGTGADELCVPDANAMVQEVVKMFDGTDENDALRTLLNSTDITQRYQEAMRFVIDCRGQDALNNIIQNAVLKARTASEPHPLDFDRLESDPKGWFLRPAVRAVGQIVHDHPHVFSEPLLTSNFDPLLEVSIRAAGGNAMTIVLPSDGQFTNVLAPDTSKVVHFHGYWHGSDTLHTPAQLTRNRPQLKGCLRNLLRETTLVVMAYGGWSDVFTRTLVEVISEQTEPLNVLWTFYSDNEEDIAKRNPRLLAAFEPLAGQRVLFYKGVDCHIFLPHLREKLVSPTPKIVKVEYLSKSEVLPPSIVVSGGSDIPPQASAWVGRETELRIMLSSNAKVIAISGFGGNGKSTLAAKYLEMRMTAGEIAHWYWADCKEQSNTLHTQLVRMVERVSRGAVRGSQLATADSEAVVDLLLVLLAEERAILVFDNIDKYVDVEERKALGTMQILFQRAMSQPHLGQFLITGRPSLDYTHTSFLQIPLSGLSIEETRRLFEMCGVIFDPISAEEKISEVHALTSGHPLALNLIANQIGKGRADFDELIIKLKKGIEAGIENPVLPNIWDTLNEKQKTVLRYLAELIHPEPEQRVASYLGTAIKYNQFSKAIRALKALHMVVVKTPGGGLADTIELHPLVRDFIRHRFEEKERTPFISSLISFCDRMIGKFRSEISSAPYSVLENWTAKVELCLRTKRYEEALMALFEVKAYLLLNGYPEEFLRLALELVSQFEIDAEDKNRANLDQVFDDLVRVLSELGRFREADLMLSKFEKSIAGKDARFILLCNIRGYSLWLRKDFEAAKQWATKGVELKASVGLDTNYDCSHTLALARRDSGEYEAALKYFLFGQNLEDILNAENYKPTIAGHYYGNIGRCLQFLSRLDEAITCLRFSARALEEQSNSMSLMNEGWAAFWIGEVLEKRGDLEVAYAAFRRAAAKWKPVSPSRHREAAHAADRVREMLPLEVVAPADDWECKRIFLEWVRSDKAA
ncbi:hypothetical protein CfE428DRAFT_0470 [Chthoniobacter flavus Ellin428]|uniref:NB-ARC domain-containing protein n=2 Tax=Chthoniobacter flavus TaxID=191863 RepID=B4CUV7_9BACT|nr:hypothetical protein CfE428DRAFT_0470 [Chthoniobacter flavus Ellin428]